MIADGCTKYIIGTVWRRHTYYMLNKGVDYPVITKKKTAGTSSAAADNSQARKSVVTSIPSERHVDVLTEWAERQSVTFMKPVSKSVVQEWADQLSLSQAKQALNTYRMAAEAIVLHGYNDKYEAEASHYASRGPALRARIALG